MSKMEEALKKAVVKKLSKVRQKETKALFSLGEEATKTANALNVLCEALVDLRETEELPLTFDQIIENKSKKLFMSFGKGYFVKLLRVHLIDNERVLVFECKDPKLGEIAFVESTYQGNIYLS